MTFKDLHKLVGDLPFVFLSKDGGEYIGQFTGMSNTVVDFLIISTATDAVFGDLDSFLLDENVTALVLDYFELVSVPKDCRCPIISLGIVHVDSCQSILTNSSNETPIFSAMR